MPRKTPHLLGRRHRAHGASMRPRPDAAENRDPAGGPGGRRAARFNEAAARCRGKPLVRQRRYDAGAIASMRPRPDAAENPAVWRRWHTASRRASMRPRPDAAENRRRAGTTATWRRRCFNEAAARCRGKPFGRRRPGRRRRRFNEAAARCRGKPRTCSPGLARTAARFNEAAARCRGKPASHFLAVAVASRLQ